MPFFTVNFALPIATGDYTIFVVYKTIITMKAIIVPKGWFYAVLSTTTTTMTTTEVMATTLMMTKVMTTMMARTRTRRATTIAFVQFDQSESSG